MNCVRCRVALVEGAGGRHEHVCPRCCGRLLEGVDASTLLFDELNVNRSWIRELLRDGKSRLPCPMCQAPMSNLQVHGVIVECCGACGAVFLDKGELSGLTGQVEVNITMADVAPSSIAVAIEDRSPRAVFLLVPSLSQDVAIAAFESSRVRTAMDARQSAAGASSGVVAVGLTITEATNLAAALTSLIHDAAVVDLSDWPLPALRRTTTAQIVGDQVLLPQQQAQFACHDISAIAYATLPAAPLPMLHKATPPRQANRFLARADAEPSEPPMARAPVVTTVVDVFVQGSRYRFDSASWIPHTSVRNLNQLVQHLDQYATTALRHRGVLAARSQRPIQHRQGMTQEIPALGSPRLFDHELQWLFWRASQ
jgi:Zn-finger nucleic acid-binding protein